MMMIHSSSNSSSSSSSSSLRITHSSMPTSFQDCEHSISNTHTQTLAVIIHQHSRIPKASRLSKCTREWARLAAASLLADPHALYRTSQSSKYNTEVTASYQLAHSIARTALALRKNTHTHKHKKSRAAIPLVSQVPRYIPPSVDRLYTQITGLPTHTNPS